MVGGLAWLSARIGLLDQRVLPASLYCGAFVGMTSSHVLPGTSWVLLAGTIAGIIYSLARHFWVGIGGKLGTIAFAGTALTVMAARLADGIMRILPLLPSMASGCGRFSV